MTKWLKRLFRPAGFFWLRGIETGKSILAHRCPVCGLLTYNAHRGVVHCGRFDKPPLVNWFLQKPKRPARSEISIAQVGLWSVDGND